MVGMAPVLTSVRCIWRATVSNDTVLVEENQVRLKLFVGITDRDWYELLRQLPGLDEVNFWAPGGTAFKALDPGELFLFKLHAPDHYIVGGGVFATRTRCHARLPGRHLVKRMAHAPSPRCGRGSPDYRRVDPASREDFVIGCRILTQPFFLERDDWIPCAIVGAADRSGEDLLDRDG